MSGLLRVYSCLQWLTSIFPVREGRWGTFINLCPAFSQPGVWCRTFCIYFSVAFSWLIPKSKRPILGPHILLPFMVTWKFPESPVLYFYDSSISSDSETARLFVRRLIYNCTSTFKSNVKCTNRAFEGRSARSTIWSRSHCRFSTHWLGELGASVLPSHSAAGRSGDSSAEEIVILNMPCPAHLAPKSVYKNPFTLRCDVF